MAVAGILRKYSTVGIERVEYDEPLEPLPGIGGFLPEDADPDNLLPRNTDVGEVEPGFIVALHAVDPQLGAGEDDFESSYIGFTVRSPGAYEPESEEDFAVEVPVFDEGRAALRTGVRQLPEDPDAPEAEAELYPPVPRGDAGVVAKLWGVPEGEEGLQPLTRDGEQIRNEATITALDQNPEVAPAGGTPPAWGQSTTLGPGDIEDSDEGPEFGASVAAGDGLSVVGAPFEDHSDDAGSVYIFEEVLEEEGPDIERIEFQPSTFSDFDDVDDGGDTSDYRFGASVAYDEGNLAIGAPGYNGVGAVYVLTRRGGAEGTETKGDWLFSKRIEGDSLSEDSMLSDFGPGAEFGAAVDLDGSAIVIGAPGANDDNGAAIFDFTVTDNEAPAFELEQPDSTGNDRVGESVAVDSEFGASLLVGAPGASNSDGTQTGAVYDFAFDVAPEGGGEGIIKYVPSDGDAGDRFGSAVDVYTGDAPLEGGLATPIVGAPDHAPSSGSDGAVSVDHIETPPASYEEIKSALLTPG